MHIERGWEVKVRGRRGRFRFQDTHITQAGRTVANLIGPVGWHERFTACYVEEITGAYPETTRGRTQTSRRKRQ